MTPVWALFASQINPAVIAAAQAANASGQSASLDTRPVHKN
jgi:hypothetical protein